MFGSAKIHIQNVSEITTSIKNKLETDFRFIHVRGEISNLRQPFSGHLYFSLKDEHAQIKAVLFKGQQKYLDKDLNNGQEIICHGRINVYEPRGEYQLIIDTVDQFGFGELQRKFDFLKRQLAKEGLFDSNQKKTLPHLPQSIVVITSPTGAALHDFLQTAHLRQTLTHILVYPVRVQGAGAGEEIAAAIDTINREVETDTIVLCRGGGSIEDLWAFNEECVARAVHRSVLPIVTGIGHEIDITITDFCADARASTPTGAAELLFHDRKRLIARSEELCRRLTTYMATELERQSNRVNQCERFLKTRDSVFITLSLHLDQQSTRLVQAMETLIHHHFSHLKTLSLRLDNQLPSVKLSLEEQRLGFLLERLRYLIQRKIDHKSAEFTKLTALLDSVSPLSILARGYSIVTKTDPMTDEKIPVKSSAQITLGDIVDVQLQKGSLECEVTGKG